MAQFKPNGYNSVSPYLIVNKAQELIEFLQKIFKVVELRKFHKTDGLIAHAEIRVEDTVIMICDDPNQNSTHKCSIHVYVEDVDEVFKKAVNAGATKPITPKESLHDPDTRGSFNDICGNHWSISSQKSNFFETKTIVVASHNPVKIEAAKSGFEKMFPEIEFRTKGVSVTSDVPDQPMTSEETLLGAINRAKNAKLKLEKADFWVGIEGGIEIVKNEMQVFAWIVILSNNQEGRAQTSVFYLPNKIKKLVESGVELGHADDIVFNRENSKQSNGAVGILTKDLIDRKDYYVEAVILALIPFVNQELYEN